MDTDRGISSQDNGSRCFVASELRRGPNVTYNSYGAIAPDKRLALAPRHINQPCETAQTITNCHLSNDAVRDKQLSTKSSVELQSDVPKLYPDLSAIVLTTETSSSNVSLPNIPSHDRRSSSFITCANLQSMILGTTTLSLPFAFSQAGMWAVPLCILIGFLTAYTGSLLYDCLHQRSIRNPENIKRVRTTFAEICTISWPRFGGIISEIMVLSALLRHVAVLVLLTDLTVEAFPEIAEEIDRGLFTLIWLLLAIPPLFIKRVSILGWISSSGLIPYILSLIAIAVLFIIRYDSWEVDNLNYEFNIEGVSVAIGIIVNSNTVHLSFPPLEASMKQPKQFKRAVYTTFILNISFKLLFSAFGVLCFGSKTQEVITGNLVENDVLPTLIRIAVILFTYLTLPMQSFVVFDLIDEKLESKSQWFDQIGITHIARKLFIRLMLLMLCGLVAFFVPHFSLVLSIIGSFRGNLIALILPCLFHWQLKSKTLSVFQKFTRLIIILFGIVCSCLGLYFSVRSLL